MELENFKYNLSRLKKCDQIWDEMRPVAGGRHCAGCNKKIVDFSQMTFTDIAFFMSESKEPVCGFYLPEQLKQINHSKSKWSLAIGLSTLIASASMAQPAKFKEQKTEQAPANKDNNGSPVEILKTKQTQVAGTIIISGKVEYYDSTRKANMPVSFASIIVKGTTLGTAATDKGEFKLHYTPRIDSTPFTIIVSSINFERKEMAITFSGDQSEIDTGTLVLEYYKGGTTEFIVSARKRSRLNKFWRKITKVFRK